MNPEHINNRWQEVLDGTRVWEKQKVSPNDDDRFRTEYVDPLKSLQAQGCFEIDVIGMNIRGQANVPIAVEIISAGINYDCRE